MNVSTHVVKIKVSIYFIDMSVLLENATRRIHTKPYPGLEWRIFHILTSDILGCRGTLPSPSLGERCVTSQKTAAKETTVVKISMISLIKLNLPKATPQNVKPGWSLMRA